MPNHKSISKRALLAELSKVILPRDVRVDRLSASRSVAELAPVDGWNRFELGQETTIIIELKHLRAKRRGRGAKK